MNSKKIKAIIATYLALAIPAVLATIVSGHTDATSILTVAAAAILAPIARGLNPHSSAYGIVKAVNVEVQKKAVAVSKKDLKK
jgi:hypothetical protein